MAEWLWSSAIPFFGESFAVHNNKARQLVCVLSRHDAKRGNHLQSVRAPGGAARGYLSLIGEM